jgi:hypothetical protein
MVDTWGTCPRCGQQCYGQMSTGGFEPTPTHRCQATITTSDLLRKLWEAVHGRGTYSRSEGTDLTHDAVIRAVQMETEFHAADAGRKLLHGQVEYLAAENTRLQRERDEAVKRLRRVIEAWQSLESNLSQEFSGYDEYEADEIAVAGAVGFLARIDKEAERE